MLLYSPPFLMVGPVTIFPDHADPDSFYYVVALPQLVVENGEPAFWATAILPPVTVDSPGPAAGQAVGRALVSFDINLPLPPDPDNIIGKEIQKRWGRPPKRVVPAPLQAGTVTLTVARPNATDAANAPKDFFVYSGHSPSLTGVNRAALALATQGDEAQALIAALSVGHLAGVVSYELDMPGLAPSFAASMIAHMSQVYEQFHQRDMTNYVFSTDEVEKTIDRLQEGKQFEVNVENLDPEGKEAAVKALFDELKSEVLKRLFQAPMPVGDVPIEDRISHGVRDVLSSALPGVTHTLRTLDQSTLTDLTIDLREQDVRIYKFYPQSTLAGLLERGGNAASRLAFVRVEDLPNRIEDVSVELAGGAAQLGVRGVDVRVQALTASRTEPLVDQSVHLDPASPQRKTVNFRRLGVEEPSIKYKVDMLMDPTVAPGGQERWTFDWRPVEGMRIWFDPAEFLDVASVRIENDDPAVFDAARVSVDIEAWLAGGTAPLRKASLQITKDAPSQTIQVVLPQGQAAAFKGRETFRRVGEADFVRDVPSITGSVHRVMNPFGQSWTMEVRAVLAQPDTASLFAEFRVWDVLRKTWLLAQQSFSSGGPLVFTLKFSTSLETPRKAEVRRTRATADGRIIRGPWQDLTGPVVAINDDVAALRRVRATLDVPQFKAQSVQKVFVDVEYHDPAHAVDAEDTLELTQDGATADWTHPLPDPTHAEYRYKVRARSTDGDRYAADWVTTGADDLTITLPANPWG